jgi:transcriptional regulator GlxA family with amidase domain
MSGGRGAGGTRDRLHRVVAVALPDVVAFDLSIAAQVFGHRDERERYAFTVCAERPGTITSTTGFTINAPAGLEVAERCGLGSAATLRVHLARQSGTTPIAYRRSHRGTSPAA